MNPPPAVDTPRFTHDRAGTPEAVWQRLLQSADLPPCPALRRLTDPTTRLVVVAAHPDDETLGVGGLISRAAEQGCLVEVVVLTDGEASHPHSPTCSPADLAATRRRELAAALDELAPGSHVTWVGLPDGALADALPTIVTTLVEIVGDHGDAVILAAPWRQDRHPDHDAAGRAAAAAALRTGAGLVEYPIWLWHWGQPGDLPADAGILRLTPAEVTRKRSAIGHHLSQIQPLSDQPGDEVLLSADVLAHFTRDVEVLLPGPLTDDALDRLHASTADPWQVETSWYEHRKRAVVMAALPRRSYDRGLEVGCSIGVLTQDLAGRCGQLTAIDASNAAIRAAGRRLSDRDDIHLVHGRVPEDWPPGRFDLIVLAEVGYFLAPTALRRTARLAQAALAGGGHLLLCHWRHPVTGWPLQGDDVHRIVAEECHRLVDVVAHREHDFALQVLQSGETR